MELLTLLLFGTIVVIVHEFGHYIAFKMVKIEAHLEFRWWGLIFDEYSRLNTSLIEGFVVAFTLQERCNEI